MKEFIMNNKNNLIKLAAMICLILISLSIPMMATGTVFAADDTTDPVEESGDEAFAVFDSSDGSLKLFRDEAGQYSDGQVIGDLTFYAGIETVSGNNGPKWSDKASLIKSFSIKDGDIIKPITCQSWFYNCTQLTDVNLSGLDTSEVKNMRNMFNNCTELESLDLSVLDTSEATSMSGMFSYCSKLVNIDLTGFDTSKVSNMYRMFYNCSSLVNLDISSFNSSVMPDETYMFYNCSNLLFIRLGPDFTFRPSCGMRTPFQRVETLKDELMTSDPVYYDFADYSGDSPGLYRIGCKSMAVFDSSDGSLVFTEDDGSEHLEKKEVIGTKTYYTKIMNTGAASPPWYENRSMIKKVSFQRDISPLSCNKWFQDCANMNVCDMLKLDTSHTTRFSNMFAGCSGLSKIALGEKTMMKVNLPYSGWKRYKMPDGTGIDGPELLNLTDYDGISPGWYSLAGSDICAVFDSKDGSLEFFVDDSEEIFNGQVTGTKTYYTGFVPTENVPWEDKKTSIRTISFRDRIEPKSIRNWFSGCTEITELDLTDIVMPQAQENAFKGCLSLRKLTVDHSESATYVKGISMLSGIWRNKQSGEEVRLVVNGICNDDVISEGEWELVTRINVELDMDLSALKNDESGDEYQVGVFHIADGVQTEGDPVYVVNPETETVSFIDEDCIYVSNSGNIEYFEYRYEGIDSKLYITWEKEPGVSLSSVKYDLHLRNSGITHITGKINWEGDRPEDRPEKVTVELWCNGTRFEEQEIQADGEWKYNFAVPTVDGNGVIYNYEVKETPLDNYKVQYDKYDGMRFVFEKIDDVIPCFIFRYDGRWYKANVNFRGGILTIPGDAFYLPWTSSPVSLSYAESIKLNGEMKDMADSWSEHPVNEEIRIDDLLLDSDMIDGVDNGTITPLTDSGSELMRIIGQDPDFGLNSSLFTLTEPYPLFISENEARILCGTLGSASITNTSVRGSMELCGKKTWDSHPHPDEITVILEQNGTDIKEKTVSGETGWTYSFSNLPIYDEDGEEYVYSITEKPLKGFQMTRETKPAENPDKAVKVTYMINSGATETNLNEGFFVSYDQMGNAYKYQHEGMTVNGEHVIVFPTMDFDLVFNGKKDVLRGIRKETKGYPVEVIKAEIIDSPYEFTAGSAFLNTDDPEIRWNAADLSAEDPTYPSRENLYHYGVDEKAALAYIYAGKLNVIPYTIEIGSPWENIRNEYREGKVIIRKTDENGDALKNAEFGLYFSENMRTDDIWEKSETEPTAKGTTNDDGELVLENIPYGCYVLEEIAAPSGYKTAKPEKVVVESNEITVSIQNETTKTIIKKANKKGQLLGGALLKLYDNNSRELDSWMTVSGEAHEIRGLTEGKEYILKEVSPPEGYETAVDISFEVEKGKDTEITMVDKPVKVIIPVPTGVKVIGFMLPMALIAATIFLLKRN